MIEIAKDFLSKAGYPFVWLNIATEDETNEQWELIFEVGLYRERKKTVTVDDKTGKVVGFE